MLTKSVYSQYNRNTRRTFQIRCPRRTSGRSSFSRTISTVTASTSATRISSQSAHTKMTSVSPISPFTSSIATIVYSPFVDFLLGRPVFRVISNWGLTVTGTFNFFLYYKVVSRSTSDTSLYKLREYWSVAASWLQTIVLYCRSFDSVTH